MSSNEIRHEPANLHEAIAIGIDRGLRDLGVDVTGCTPSMLTGHVIQELKRLPGWRLPAPQIATVEELAAVAPGTIIRAADGTIACRHPAGVGVVFGDERPFEWSVLQPPAVVLWTEKP